MHPHTKIIYIVIMEKNLINELSPKGKIFLQIFLRFLKENNYFCKYKKAFEMYESTRSVNLCKLISYCNRLSPHIVDFTLCWSATLEGLDYWEHVNAQFEDLCNRILK